MTYSVVYEIEVDAESPLEAAKQVNDLITGPDYGWQYYVQGDDKVIYSVDLSESDVDSTMIIDDYVPLVQY